MIIIDDDNNIMLSENRIIIGKYEKFGNLYLFKPLQSYFGEEIVSIGKTLKLMNNKLWKEEILNKLEYLKESNNSETFNFVAFNRFKKDLEEYLI